MMLQTISIPLDYFIEVWGDWMRVRPIPKSWLIHEISYAAYEGKDDFSNPKYAIPVKMEFVRFDDSTVFSRDATQKKIIAEGVIFVDAKHSTNIPKQFIKESIITFEGRDYILKKDIPCYYPKKNKIHHYELEVI